MSRYSVYIVDTLSKEGQEFQEKACGYCKRDVKQMMESRSSSKDYVILRVTRERTFKKSEWPGHVKKKTTLADARLALVTAFQNHLMEDKEYNL